MPTTGLWFAACGFTVFHVPGVSRAWQCDLADGSYVLITDPGGYDLPQRGGPYAAMSITSNHLLIEIQNWLQGTRELVHWLHHTQRLARRRLLDATGEPLASSLFMAFEE